VNVDDIWWRSAAPFRRRILRQPARRQSGATSVSSRSLTGRFPDKRLAGRPSAYAVTIKGIKKKTLPG